MELWFIFINLWVYLEGKKHRTAGALWTPYIVPILTLNNKHMSGLLAGKRFSDFSTKDDNFIDAKNRAGFFSKVFGGIFERFPVAENFFRSDILN